MDNTKKKIYRKDKVLEESSSMPEIFKKIKAIKTDDLDLAIKEGEVLLKQRKEEFKILLRNHSKTDLIEMILNEGIKSIEEKFLLYKKRNRGKEQQLENRKSHEILAENLFKEILAKKEKLTLNTLTYALMEKHPSIRWQNNSDPDLVKKKLKDVVKLKAIYNKLRKKYVS
jgi:hypothetical protein